MQLLVTKNEQWLFRSWVCVPRTAHFVLIYLNCSDMNCALSEVVVFILPIALPFRIYLMHDKKAKRQKKIAQPHHIFNLRSESAPWLNHSFNFSLLYHFHHLLRCDWRWSNRMSLRVTLCNWINIVFGYALVWRDAKSLNYYYHRLRAVPFISHQWTNGRTNECSRIVLLAIASISPLARRR